MVLVRQMSRQPITAFTVMVGLSLLAAPPSHLSAAERENTKALAAMTSKGHINYPYEAKKNLITGAGVAVVSINPAGQVTNVTMAVSTGSPILDRATIDGLQSAKFKPGTVPLVKIPVRFTMSGVQLYDYYDIKKKDMDDVLAAFLGKGTVRKGPIPAYPRRPA